jgi:acetyl esterase/lipase
MRYLSYLLIATIFLSICCAGDKNSAPEPPSGYLNYTFIKIAYVLKMIKLIERQPMVPETLLELKDIEYKKVGEHALKLDLYRLKSLNQPAPVLIFIHGGGWRIGKRSDYLPYLIDFAERGYVTATVSYRLQKQAKFPAAVQDVQCAIKWIRAHARDYFIDPDKIAVIGGSAGGHLALMAGFAADDSLFAGECESDSVSSRVQAVVNLYGPADLTTAYAQARPEATGFIGQPYSEAAEMYRKASPLFYITRDDPPTLIFHGTIDDLVPVSQSDSLKQKLDETGVPGEYHRLKGWPHTMDLVVSVNRYCQYYMHAFFEKYIPIVKNGVE